MVWRLALFVWIAGWLVAAFTWAPVVPMLEATTRVLYFHIPAAWVTVLALIWSAIHSYRFLKSRDLRHDDVAAGSAELGILFCVGATVSGALWAKAMWGSYWNWDPRETAIFFLLMIYFAYLTLRGTVEDPERRARLSAVYSMVASVTVPFLIFVVPRLMFTLHPDPLINNRGKVDMDPAIRWCFLAMLVGFTVLFYWMLSLRVRVGRIERQRMMASAG